MKVRIFLFILICSLGLISCNALYLHSKKGTFYYLVRKSPYYDLKNLKEIDRKWRKLENDTVIYTIYFKGAICDIPNSEKMSIKITNDTLVFNYGRSKDDADCERRFGVAGIMVDFVLNKRKFSNYKDLKIKYITFN